MATDLTNGEEYRFGKVGTSPVLLGGSDDAHSAKIIRNQTQILKNDANVTALYIRSDAATGNILHLDNNSEHADANLNDCHILFQTGNRRWIAGIDGSDDHSFKIAFSTGFNTGHSTNDFKITNTGYASFYKTLTISGSGTDLDLDGGQILNGDFSNLTPTLAGISLGTAGQINQFNTSTTSNSTPVIKASTGEKIAWLAQGYDTDAEASQKGYIGYDGENEDVLITTFDGSAWRSTRFSDDGVFGGSNHGITSDERLKTNITNITGSINKIKQLQGVTFDWKSTTSGSIGFIAQEVEKIFPELIMTSKKPAGPVQEADVHGEMHPTGVDGSADDTSITNPDDSSDSNWGLGNIKSIQYSPIIALLTEGIKEQQTIIDDLKSRIVALENA